MRGEEDGMTVFACPAGCGGFINTEISQVCSGCRMSASEQRVKIDDDWCWQWFGPSFHRMKCRRKLGHSGECHDHPDDDPLCIASFADRKFDYDRKDDGLLYAVSKGEQGGMIEVACIYCGKKEPLYQGCRSEQNPSPRSDNGDKPHVTYAFILAPQSGIISCGGGN